VPCAEAAAAEADANGSDAAGATREPERKFSIKGLWDVLPMDLFFQVPLASDALPLSKSVRVACMHACCCLHLVTKSTVWGSIVGACWLAELLGLKGRGKQALCMWQVVGSGIPEDKAMEMRQRGCTLGAPKLSFLLAMTQ
jgi:hypothetical protein